MPSPPSPGALVADAAADDCSYYTPPTIRRWWRLVTTDVEALESLRVMGKLVLSTIIAEVVRNRFPAHPVSFHNSAIKAITSSKTLRLLLQKHNLGYPTPSITGEDGSFFYIIVGALALENTKADVIRWVSGVFFPLLDALIAPQQLASSQTLKRHRTLEDGLFDSAGPSKRIRNGLIAATNLPNTSSIDHSLPVACSNVASTSNQSARMAPPPASLERPPSSSDTTPLLSRIGPPVDSTPHNRPPSPTTPATHANAVAFLSSIPGLSAPGLTPMGFTTHAPPNTIRVSKPSQFGPIITRRPSRFGDAVRSLPKDEPIPDITNMNHLSPGPHTPPNSAIHGRENLTPTHRPLPSAPRALLFSQTYPAPRPMPPRRP